MNSGINQMPPLAFIANCGHFRPLENKEKEFYAQSRSMKTSVTICHRDEQKPTAKCLFPISVLVHLQARRWVRCARKRSQAGCAVISPVLFHQVISFLTDLSFPKLCILLSLFRLNLRYTYSYDNTKEPQTVSREPALLLTGGSANTSVCVLLCCCPGTRSS